MAYSRHNKVSAETLLDRGLASRQLQLPIQSLIELQQQIDAQFNYYQGVNNIYNMFAFIIGVVSIVEAAAGEFDLRSIANIFGIAAFLRKLHSYETNLSNNMQSLQNSSLKNVLEKFPDDMTTTLLKRFYPEVLSLNLTNAIKKLQQQQTKIASVEMQRSSNNDLNSSLKVTC